MLEYHGGGPDGSRGAYWKGVGRRRGVVSKAMILVHHNLISRSIIVFILTSLAYFLTPKTTSGGVGKNIQNEQDQDKENVMEKVAELTRTRTTDRYQIKDLGPILKYIHMVLLPDHNHH